METLPTAPHTVLLVDDSPAVREAMRWAFENAPDFSVIGEAGDAAEALEQTAMLHPDVVLLDIELPDLDGYAVSRALKAGSSAPIVVFLTVHSDLESQRRGKEAGGDGFAAKGAGWTALITQIRDAMKYPVEAPPSLYEQHKER